jgi:hypothetical protein
VTPNQHYYRLYNEPSYRLQFYCSYLQRIGQAGRLVGHPSTPYARPETGKEVMADKNPFYTAIAEGDTRTVVAIYRKGAKHLRYNAKKNVIESIIVENDCEVDELQKWDRRENAWKYDATLWETARALPPPAPPEPKPPGFWAKLWAKLTGRQSIPQAKLLKG